MQMHNLGYLRLNCENALVALLSRGVPVARISPAYTDTAASFPSVIVHASKTREMTGDVYRLERYIDVFIVCATYAEADADSLLEAREAHHKLLSQVYGSLAQADVVETLNDLALPGIEFWSLYAQTDEGGISEQSFVSTISVEVGATPREIEAITVGE